MNMTISDIIDLIITSLASFAAVVALCISIWQTKWPYKVRIRIKATVVSHKWGDDKGFYAKKYLLVRFQNIGLADASILCWGIMTGKTQRFNCQHYGETLLTLRSKTLMDRRIPLELFQEVLKDVPTEKIKDKTLRVFVREIGGKEFSFKTNTKTNDLLKMGKSDFISVISEDDYFDGFSDNVGLEQLRSYLSEHGFNNR